MPEEPEAALDLLGSPSWEDRVEAVRLLSACNDPRALEGLKRALHDTANTAVIEAAAEALLKRFDSFSMAALTDAFKSEDFDVSQTVADVLFGASERGRFAKGLHDGV